MDGTLSPDGKFVLHRSQWIPASLSPDHIWYAHEGEWYPLSPPSITLAKRLYSPPAGLTEEQTKQVNLIVGPRVKLGNVFFYIGGIIVFSLFLFFTRNLDVSQVDPVFGFIHSGVCFLEAIFAVGLVRELTGR